MNENLKYFIIILPLLISFLISLVGKKIKNTDYKKAWFEPPSIVFSFIWTYLYVVLGVLLYKSIDIEDYNVLYLTILILILTYIFTIFFTHLQNYKLCMWILFAILILSFILYTELYYSDMTDDNRYYVHNFSVFVSWIIIAIVLLSHSTDKKYNKVL